MGIYDYPRKTTPLLAKEQGLLAFKNVISSNAHTIASLSKALTFADLHNQTPHANVLQLLNSAGFVTFWLSAQPRLGISETTISLIANSATHTWYSTQQALERSTGEYRLNYDEILLGELKKALVDPAEKKAIVLHLMGNHSPYSYRFPDQFNIFNGIAPEFNALTYEKSSSKKRKMIMRTINEYDNAVAYNDYVVSTALDMLRNSTSEYKFFLYFSDHGDEVYCDQDYAGHAEQRPSRSMFEIPFLVWLSPKAQEQLPTLQRPDVLYRPYQTDDLIHTLLQAAAISHPLYAPSKSLFSDSFYPKERKIGRNDYEDMRSKPYAHN
jgi:heptose-I-phosphate ethanolaminephosphotransferase